MIEVNFLKELLSKEFISIFILSILFIILLNNNKSIKLKI